MRKGSDTSDPFGFSDATYRAGTRSTLLWIDLPFSDSFEQLEKGISKHPKP